MTFCAAMTRNPMPYACSRFEKSRSRELRGDLAPVGEERHVQRRERLPAVLGVHQQHVRVAEAVVALAAERLAAAERRLIVERHPAAADRVGAGHRQLEREDPLLVEDREELAQPHVDRVEAVLIEVSVGILPQPEGVVTAGARVAGLVPVIDLREPFTVQERRLLGQPGRVVVVEHLFD